MKQIESFTAVATVLNSERVVRWSSVAGLTIEGLTRTDAAAVMRLIESVSERAREQAQATPPPPVAPDEIPAPPPPAAQNRAPSPSKPPAPAQIQASEPAEAPESPAEASDSETPAQIPPAENASQERSQARTQSAQKRADPAPRKRVPRREVADTPAAPDPAPPWETPKEGDDIDGEKVRAVKPTVEGGAVVTLTNGTRIKYDDKGREVNRIVPEAKPQPSTDEAPSPPSNTTPPDDVMKTRMTRDVLQWVQAQGVTGRDQIVAECERLKDIGAVAFSTCPDVRQRVTTVLTAMGVA